MTACGRGHTVAAGLATGQDSFGLVRLALALAVVVSHGYSVISGLGDDEPLALLTGFTLGEHAVNGFFAVSGFLVAMSFDRRGLAAYALARAMRILPGLVVALLVVALVAGPLLSTLAPGAYFRDGRLWRFLIQALTTLKSTGELPGVFQENPFRFPMGTIWTLKYEIYCYLGLALAGAAGALGRRKAVLAAVVLLGVAIMGMDLLRPEAGKGLQTALRLPFAFACGTCLYLWRERAWLSWPLALGLIGLVTVLQGTFAYKALLFAGEAYLVLVASIGPGAGRLPEPKDDLSYGTYLYGWPVQQALHALFPKLGVFSLLVPSLVLTLIVAALSWRLVEKPALAVKARGLARLGRSQGGRVQS